MDVGLGMHRAQGKGKVHRGTPILQVCGVLVFLCPFALRNNVHERHPPPPPGHCRREQGAWGRAGDWGMEKQTHLVGGKRALGDGFLQISLGKT